MAGLALADALVGALLLGILNLSASPSFGPAPWALAFAQAYEAVHWPLNLAVLNVQLAAGQPGSLAQAWTLPAAQLIRLAVFAANTALLTRLLWHLLTGGHGEAPTDPPQILQARLRQWLAGNWRWPSGGPDSPQPGGLRRDLRALGRVLAVERARPEDLRSARGRLLRWVGQEGASAEFWLQLAQATWRLAVGRALEPDAEGMRFAELCARRALAINPQELRAWRCLAAWKVLQPDDWAQAPSEVRPGLEGFVFLDALETRARAQVVLTGEVVEQIQSRLPGAKPGLRLRAELLEKMDRPRDAFHLWRELLQAEPWDGRWYRAAHASAERAGIPPSERRLDFLPFESAQAGDWVCSPEGPARRPRSRRLGYATAALIYALLGWALCRPIFAAAGVRRDWIGRWTCRAIVSPSGQRIPMGKFPATYSSYLPEEACGYTAITALAPRAAFVLTREHGQEIYLEGLHSVRWEEDAWGLCLRVESYHPLPLHLRPVADGVEMALPGQTWTLLFERDDHVGPAVKDRWSGERAAVVETSGGTFLCLGDRGWTRLGEVNEALPLFEGSNSDLQPERDPDAPSVLFAWSTGYTVPAVSSGTRSKTRACGYCSRPSDCAGRPAGILFLRR